MHRSFCASFDKGKLTVNQRRGIISLLPKGNKPRENLKNWRPISLLNVTYKLLSGVIARRLRSVMDVLIHENQRGFISGRFIGENTRLLYDCMHYCNAHEIPGFLLLLDFEKAFDSVSWKFIFNVLNYFNFGKNLISWIKIFFNEFSLCVSQNGFSSEYFTIGRDCRQGDPASPYIFLLCVEIMGAMIRNDEQIKGITINEHEYKLLQYADDTALLLDGQENSLRRALSLIDQFSKYSGLKPNYSKTSCIRIGAYRYSDVQYCNEYNIQWADINFTFLGIDFTVDLIDITDLNIDKRLTEISTVIKHWNRRIISTLGRITVLKTILLPKLTHIFMSLPDPSVAKIKYLESLFFKFIWCNKQDKINRKLAVQHPKDGGLNMVCIRSFINGLKITWVRRLLNTSNVSWSRFLEVIFPDLREGVSTFGNEYLKTIVSTANPFWGNVFTSLYDLRSIVDNDDFLVQSVWFNNNVQINGRSIFLRTWKNRGINHILDFFDANYVFLSYTDFCEKYMFNPPFTIFYGIVQSIKIFS